MHITKTCKDQYNAMLKSLNTQVTAQSENIFHYMYMQNQM